MSLDTSAPWRPDFAWARAIHHYKDLAWHFSGNGYSSRSVTLGTPTCSRISFRDMACVFIRITVVLSLAEYLVVYTDSDKFDILVSVLLSQDFL